MNDEPEKPYAAVQRPAWEAAEREQAMFIVQNTTAEQRFEWLEETLELFKAYLPRRDGPLPDDDEFAREYFRTKARERKQSRSR